MTLSQKAYIDSVITKFRLDDTKPVSMPMETGVRLDLTQPIEPMSTPYKEIVSSLMYAATGTRPDIAFATSTLAQYMQNPGRAHWEAAKRVVRYLKGSCDLELTYGGTSNGIEAYTDADHASQTYRHSISGYAFLINGGAVSWSSKKQPLIALSTTEAEYIAAAHLTKEALWI